MSLPVITRSRRWLAELARRASPARQQERDEATHRLRDLWQKTKTVVERDNFTL